MAAKETFEFIMFPFTKIKKRWKLQTSIPKRLRMKDTNLLPSVTIFIINKANLL